MTTQTTPLSPAILAQIDRMRDPLTGEVKKIVTHIRSAPHTLSQMLTKKQYGRLEVLVMGTAVTLWSYIATAPEITPDVVLTPGFFNLLPSVKNGDRVQCLVGGVPFDVTIVDAKAEGGVRAALVGLPKV